MKFFMKNSPHIFFPVLISEWNSLDINIRNSSINVFQKDLSTFIRPDPNCTYIHDTTQVITNSGTFKSAYPQFVQMFKILEQQLTSFFTNHHHCARKTRSHKINKISGTISRQSDSTIAKILLFTENKIDFETSKISLMSIIKLMLLTERFCCPSFQQTLMIQQSYFAHNQ